MHNDEYLVKKYLAKIESSKSRGIEFSLSFTSFKNLMRAKKCFYTGISLTDPISGPQLPTGRTIDRLNCNKGYIHGNVVACCFAANQLKSAIENSPQIKTKNLLKIAKYSVQKTTKNKKPEKQTQE